MNKHYKEGRDSANGDLQKEFLAESIADAHTCPNAKIHLERLPKRREATLAGAERLTERRRAK